jgi:hypothetical protein
MILEITAAVLLGALLLWLALGTDEPRVERWADLVADPLEDTPRGRALLAIRELEFDRETGKIADGDYQALRAQLSRDAVRLIEASPGREAADAGPTDAEPANAICSRCGPRPEPAALFCSSCGQPVHA